MRLRRDARPILMGAPTLFESIQQSDKKIVLMVHGSCMNDLQWNRQGHNHGTALENDFEFFPVFLHYNTGRHISENGRELANLLEAFVKHLPWSIELIIIAHSMGGLVSRSACYYGNLAQHTWFKHLKKLIFLGTPHHGALLEKSGNWVDILLEANPYSAPFAKLGKLRSSGLTDLRYGNILDEDWKGSDRFKYSGDNRKATPLPDNVQCYTIAATAGKKPGRINDDLIGDGLVTLNSALGRNKNPDLNLVFPESHQWIGRNMNHVDLLNHPDVYKTIKKFARVSA
jgi:pimeloyl-ACP methyl ester carboxylesterase